MPWADVREKGVREVVKLRLAAVLTAATIVSTSGLAACGGSSGSKTATPTGSGTTAAGGGTTAAKEGGTVTVLMGTAPDSLDPQYGYTTQAAEADWLAYTPLLTYGHSEGVAGSKLIPGLASDLAQVSADGLTYTLHLRSGLTYSNGAQVKASDFAYTIQRAIKINWGGKSFFTDYVKGATEYDTAKATTISGITTDDGTGTITITLLKPYGAFANVLAFPAAGLVPTGTEMKNLPNSPPPGVGTYSITNVVANQGFTLQKNANFNIPGIPKGHLDTINVKVTSNTLTEAEQVLSNQADVFDSGDTIPPTLLGQITSTAKDRFLSEPIPSNLYFFFNVNIPPFNNPLARQAVNYALDRRALQRLASGLIKPLCWFLPPSITGYPNKPCPYGGDPNGPPDLAKAKALVQQANLVGAPVTVWGQTRSPRQEYIHYYTSVLNQIGFKATEHITQDSVYFQTIGNANTKPQTGFADWINDFPHPSDFYLLLDARSIQPQNSVNYGGVNDPHIQSELDKLNAIPATKLQDSAAEWQALEEYQAQQAYVAVFGTLTEPKFLSTKINFKKALFHPLFLDDWSSWQLN
jgi:peptide/nickel transport system substrate-binding protein